MRVFELSSIQADRPTIILLNGGGQRPYSKFHKATKLFKKYQCNLVTVELPGHGKSAFSVVMSPDEVIGQFANRFQAICKRYNQVALFGFSLGALYALKAVELQLYDFDFVCAVGAAVVIDEQQETVMQDYTTTEFFEKMRWGKHMLEYHEDWSVLLTNISDMLLIGSPLFVNPTSYPSTVPTYIILGDQDEVADYKLQSDFVSNCEKCHLEVIPDTSHFEYFSKSYKILQDRMDEILSNYLLKD